MRHIPIRLFGRSACKSAFLPIWALTRRAPGRTAWHDWAAVGGTIMAGSYFHHPGRLVAMIVSHVLQGDGVRRPPAR